MGLLNQFAQYSGDFSEYGYQTTTSSNSTSAAAIVAVLFVGALLFLAVYVFFSICLAKIFKKAGRSDTWAAWVPFYNQYVLYEVAGRPGWWALVGLIPLVGGIVGLVLAIIALIDLSKSFNKGGGFAALLILLPIIGYPMLAFGSAQYQGSAGPEGRATPPVGPPTPLETPPQPPMPPTPPQPPTMSSPMVQ